MRLNVANVKKYYGGETGWTLKKWISEHKLAVNKGDNNNRIAVHVKNKGHSIKWEEAETGCWKRRVQEAIRIQRQPSTMNLDCGMILS